MKNLLFILIILHTFLFQNLFFQPSRDREFASDIEADYVLIYKPDSTKNETREEYMELLLNKQESVFRSKKRGVVDSIRKMSKQADINSLGMMRANITSINYYIYKKGDNIITQDEYQIKPNAMFYTEPNKFNWKVDGDTATISGLKCQKASTNFGGRHWIAWFAQEIPLDGGPYKFSGLPGLIVRVYDVNKNWYFDLTVLAEKTKSIRVEFDHNAKNKFMTKKNFFKAKKNYTLNRTKLEEASGFIMSMNDQAKLKSYEADRKRAESDNNWIELYDAIVK